MESIQNTNARRGAYRPLRSGAVLVIVGAVLVACGSGAADPQGGSGAPQPITGEAPPHGDAGTPQPQTNAAFRSDRIDPDMVDTGHYYIAAGNLPGPPYLSAQGGNDTNPARDGSSGSVAADRQAVGPWEVFTIESFPTAPVGALMTQDNGNGIRYITAENAGGGQASANRTERGPWELLTYDVGEPNASPPRGGTFRAYDGVHLLRWYDDNSPPDFTGTDPNDIHCQWSINQF
jgi:hypothetical protein